MKSFPTARAFSAIRILTALSLCTAVSGCERRGEPAPQANPTPEAPMVPQVSPAKPEPIKPGTEPPAERMGADVSLDRSGAPMPTPAATDVRREATAKFKVVPGSKMTGTAHLSETATGVKVVVDLQNGPPGMKGIHVHEKGDCSDIPNKSMGEHFAPDIKTHGLPDTAAHHLGDLGNIDIGKNGNAHLEFNAEHANLKDKDAASYLGRAIVIHESNDKGTQPSGGSGKPMACAVIEKD